MKRSRSFLSLVLALFSTAALAEGTPKIQFDQTVYDIGKTSQVESVSGAFKFKNAGDGILKLEQPKPSCGCTVATLKTSTLKPGESGEIGFTLNLGRYKAHLEKHISVVSNDPQTPHVELTIKADYTPLYDVSPTTLSPNIPLESKETNLVVTVSRTDGQSLHIHRVDTSKPWITAKVDPTPTGTNSSARILVNVQSDGSPRRFTEYVQVYADDKTNSPVSTVFVYGRIMGELSLVPEALYWSVTDPAKIKAEHPDPLVTRRITVRSANGKTFELKNPKSSVKEINVELVPKEAGKVYELVAKLADVPEKTTTGVVSFESTLATQPKVEVPLSIYVFAPAQSAQNKR